jgi:hypothetical protein
MEPSPIIVPLQLKFVAGEASRTARSMASIFSGVALFA